MAALSICARTAPARPVRRRTIRLRCWSYPPGDPHHREVEENRRVEDDARYRRVDLSLQHAYAARQAFLQNIAAGEGGVDLAAAALQVAQEDDAIISHSAVQLPVASYLQRLRRLASDAAAALADTAAAEVRQCGERERREAQLAAVQAFLYGQQRFRLPPSGRSAVPAGAVVDHPGVWESARYAYLNECLVTREGIPALLAIVLADVMRRLLEAGAVDFAVRLDCSDLGALPTAEVLSAPRQALLRPDGTALTTCSSAVLVELLRFLKRAYWPFPWHGRHGGFRGAAKVFLEGDSSATMQAINRTARHRLERGIWTSPGAGDIRRALAACERLVVLCGDASPAERRDLGVLLMHVGRFAEARAELRRFQELSAAAAAASGTSATGVAFAISPTGLMAAVGQSFEEQQLADRLLQLLPPEGPLMAGSIDIEGEEGEQLGRQQGQPQRQGQQQGGGQQQQQPPYLTLGKALARPPPPPAAEEAARLPLTW